MSSAEEPAGGDVEVRTPFTEEQVEFMGSLVERSVSKALESRENTDPPPSTDPPGPTKEVSVTYHLSDARARRPKQGT